MSQAPVNRHHYEALSVGHRAGHAIAGRHRVANSISYMHFIAESISIVPLAMSNVDTPVFHVIYKAIFVVNAAAVLASQIAG